MKMERRKWSMFGFPMHPLYMHRVWGISRQQTITTGTAQHCVCGFHCVQISVRIYSYTGIHSNSTNNSSRAVQHIWAKYLSRKKMEYIHRDNIGSVWVYNNNNSDAYKCSAVQWYTFVIHRWTLGSIHYHREHSLSQLYFILGIIHYYT